MTDEPLRVLSLEDSPFDAELNQRALQKGGMDTTFLRVETEDALHAALREFSPEIVLADFNLPQYDGLKALRLVRELAGSLPFIFVSGAIGEEMAVKALHQGADDYIIKDRLARLPEAVRRALVVARHREELRRSQETLRMYERLVSTTHDLMSFVDLDYRYRIVNRAYAEAHGREVSEIIGMQVIDLMGNDAFNNVIKPMLERCFAGERVDYQREFNMGGNRRYMDVVYQPFRSSNDVVIGAVVSVHDVTTLHRAQEKLEQAAEVFRSTVEGVTITDTDGNILDVNEAFTEITGYSREEAIGENPRILKSGRHGNEFYEQMWQSLLNVGSWRGEIWNRRKDGFVYPELLTISAVRDTDGRPGGYVAVFSDITSTKQTEERLHFLAHHDALTELPNRLLLNARLEQSVQLAARQQRQLAVIFVDLDRFKLINDSLGHAAGDDLLQQLARRIRGAVRTEDTVGRISGDEFVILAENIDSTDNVVSIVNKLMMMFHQPFVLNGQQVSMTASLGISIYPNDGSNAVALLRNADAAMYRAKDSGRNTYQFYTDEMTRFAFEHVFLETAMRRALATSAFRLVYQPQLSLATSAIVGVEALIRWRDVDRGEIAPDQFIPVAEQCGLIREIGQWVLEAACTQAADWRARGVDFGRMAINISGPQIHDPQFQAGINNALKRHGLLPQDLELEVTEGFVMQRMEQSIKQLEDLHAQGVTIAIDDFGTGYSSLSYLKSLPVDKLKIDRTFIRDIPEDPDDVAISQAIIALGAALDLKIIAEGVETEAQAALLAANGCHEAQGFYFSRPLAPMELERLLLKAAHPAQISRPAGH